MPDAEGSPHSRRPRRVAAARSLVIAAALGVAFALPALVAAAPPPETCAPGETRIVLNRDLCGAGGGGGGGLNVGGLLPLVGAAVVGGIATLLIAFLIVERRTTAKLAPVQPGEWWTCGNCGKTNVVGSPRCYACGSWQS